MVSGSRGTVNICPIENPTIMTYSDIGMIGEEHYHDVKKKVRIKNDLNSRYDEMLKDFYSYINGMKKNPFTYEHDYLVQKVILEIVGGAS